MGESLQAAIAAIPGVSTVRAQAGALWAEAPSLDPEAMARAMAALGLRLGTITGIPLGEAGETRIIYHYFAPDCAVNVRTTTRNGALTSIAAGVTPAAWAEREIRDLFAVEFQGHPDPRPLIKPADCEPGMFREPMCGPVRARKIVR